MHKAFRIVLWVIFSLTVFLIAVALLVQTAPVQNWLIQRATNFLNSDSQFETSIGRIHLNWMDALSLSDVEIRDHRDSIMIGAGEIFVDFELGKLLAAGQPSLDQVRIEKAKIQLLTHQGDSSMNINLWVNELSNRFSSGGGAASPKFGIGQIDMRNSSFALVNFNSEPISEGLDYNRMRFEDISISASEFYLDGGEIGIKIAHMVGLESASGLNIKEFRTDFIYSPRFMEFANLKLVTNESHIKDFLRLEYSSVGAFSEFITEVTINANMKETTLGLGDLRFFAPTLPDIQDELVITGNFTGPVSEIKTDEFILRLGEKTEVFGSILLDGLPDIENTYINLSLQNSTLDTKDLSPYLPESSKTEVLKFGTIRLSSNFRGFLDRFDTDGDFRTSIGKVSGRIRYENQNGKNEVVSRVDVENFNLGILTDQRETFQKISLSGTVEAEGKSLDDLLLDLDANVSNFGLLGYNYTGIQTDAKYGLELFEGNISINDPNLKLNGGGSINLKDSSEAISLLLTLDSANLQAINLIDTPAYFKGKLEIDTQGINIDDLTGIMRFNDLVVGYQDRVLEVGDFYFQSLFAGGTRTMSLNSDYIVAGASGQFKLEQMAKDLPFLLQQYLAILLQDEAPVAENTDYFSVPYNLDLNINLIDINPILRLLKPDLYISKNTLVEGAFYQTEENTIFNFFSGIDTLRYGANEARQVNIDFNTSKIINSPEILASFYIFSKQQNIGGKLDFSNLGFEAIWNNDALDLNLALDQDSTRSKARVNAVAQFSPSQTTLQLKPSQLTVLSSNWQFDPNNLVTLLPGSVKFENLMLISGEQKIDLEGVLSNRPEDEWTLSLDQVNANILNTLTPQEYEGKVNGLIRSSTGEAGKMTLDAEIGIKNLTINEIPIGDLSTEAHLKDDAMVLQIENMLDGKKTITLGGDLELGSLEFDLNGKLQEAEIKIFEPFLSNYLSDMGGQITGDIQLKGDAINPTLVGEGKIDQGKLRVNYLNTLYQLDGSVLFTPGQVRFDKLIAKDVRGNTADLKGGLNYQGLDNIRLDIQADLRNFQVMNTSAKDNEVFYGNIYVTGEMDLSGNTDNLIMDARARSERDTRIFIPLSSSNEQVSEDYITFINIYDTVSVQSINEEIDRLDIQNFQMNFTMEVTPDAYAEIIIDPRTQEKISGRGRGVLTMNIDTQGTFQLNGTYEVTEASYDFSLYNVVNKKFTVQPGGRISWYGDPYEGILDLTAQYTESVSIQPLLATSTTQDQQNGTNRRYPVSVIMNLDGELMSPDISFGFDFSELPNSGEVQTAISSFQSRIANDEQEMNRQVFSVIMSRSFSPEGQFAGVNSISNSLGQLLSAQLNSLASQVDKNLEINIDLANLDQNTLETFQLSVAYTFLDGRLRVSRDGGFTDNTGQAGAASIIGDWQAEYLLTDDGVYRMRIFNRNNFNTFTSLSLSQNIVTYGVALTQNVSFNSFSELFQKITQRKEKKRNTSLIEDSDNYLRFQEEADWKPIDLSPVVERLDSIYNKPVQIIHIDQR